VTDTLPAEEGAPGGRAEAAPGLRREERPSIGASSLWLRDLWYFAMPSRTLPRGRLVARRFLNEHLVFGRDKEGRPFALHNVCRHQASPLSRGRFDGERIECPNHGWLYDTRGRCVGIPCLSESQKLNIDRIRVTSYPCRDVQGNVWIYMGEAGDAMPEPPELPEVRAEHLRIDGIMSFPCSMDRATLTLIDPAHGPYVHSSWFWRGAGRRSEKERRFTPSHLGFTLQRHKPSRNSRGFRLLPRDADMEIRFQLPGVHFECMRMGKHAMAGMITATPVTENETQINYNVYWTFPWLSPLKPLIAPFVHYFFGQDLRGMEGLEFVRVDRPPLTLVGDPDAQAVWYFKLKSEFLNAKREGRPFVNPVQETVLRWRT
jgi:phenylpropionate dioxygenase-like ring-hydroxylating dioxygenase large terminal subunit